MLLLKYICMSPYIGWKPAYTRAAHKSFHIIFNSRHWNLCVFNNCWFSIFLRISVNFDPTILHFSRLLCHCVIYYFPHASQHDVNDLCINQVPAYIRVIRNCTHRIWFQILWNNVCIIKQDTTLSMVQPSNTHTHTHTGACVLRVYSGKTYVSLY